MHLAVEIGEARRTLAGRSLPRNDSGIDRQAFLVYRVYFRDGQNFRMDDTPAAAFFLAVFVALAISWLSASAASRTGSTRARFRARRTWSRTCRRRAWRTSAVTFSIRLETKPQLLVGEDDDFSECMGARFNPLNSGSMRAWNPLSGRLTRKIMPALTTTLVFD